MFDYKTGGPQQLWIAGEIGLTPFLTFIRDLDGDLAQAIDFYYTSRHPEEALFLEEIKSAAQKNPRFRPSICFSATEGPLSMEYIRKNTNGNLKDDHVYLCGSLPMTQSFEKKFIDQGVAKDHVHCEEFNFR